MDKPAVSIVIPLHNEAARLGDVVAQVCFHIDGEGLGYEIILVDDGSTDETWEVIRRLAGPGGAIKGVRLSRNFGKEAAVAAGLSVAAGDAVIVMDGDLQHPPGLIPVMIEQWRNGGFDIVEAVKADRGQESLNSRARAALFYSAMRYLTTLDLRNTSDYKLLSRKVVDAHNAMPERSRFFRGIVSWMGFRKLQVAFSVGDRIAGESRWSPGRLLKLGVDAATAFSSVPLHLVTVLGSVMLAVSFVMAAHTLYMKLSGKAVSGFATVILLLLFVGSSIMISLGIIGIYISRIYEEVKGRPRFIVDQTANF